ncbi:MAG: hypothetical protein A2017_20225 [Lentisphaerae bacterium GWF2_44_16]|nr:MAG: hypothetical protein A2017_20225 [Lentisphaerae bacterium GWF2_44_16]
MDIDEKNKRFTILWTAAMPTVSSYVFSMLPNRSEHDDIIQNTALAALKKFDRYEESRSFLSWVIGIAKYEILGSRRNFARTPFIPLEPIIDRIADLHEEMTDELDERSAALRKCMEELKGKNLSLLQLRYKESMNFEKAASELGIAPGAARTAVSRIRGSLKKCIEQRMSAL